MIGDAKRYLRRLFGAAVIVAAANNDNDEK